MKTTHAKVLLVDDHTMMRDGLRRILQGQEGITVVGEAVDARSTLDQVRALTPEVVVMDVYLGPERGTVLARDILAEFPDVKIVMLSADSSLPVVTEALQAGVSAYVAKENEPVELIHAIRAVMDNRTYFCHEASSVLMRDYLKTLTDKKIESPKPVLTDRERHLLKLIAEGKRNKEIAVLLGVSVKSVETYRPRLMKKLGCASSSDLTRYAIREGIVSL